MSRYPIARVRARAARRDYASMARLARTLYGRSLGPREVLRECYGADFPEEFRAIAGQRMTTPGLMVHYTSQPWDLGVPLSEGGPPPPDDLLIGSAEERIVARHRDLIPLMELIGTDTTLEHVILCYRRSRLRAGDPAVFGIEAAVRWWDRPARCGDSLLPILHTHHVEYLRYVEWVLDQPENWGFGALEARAADEVRSLIARIEALQRRVAADGTG
jgi:hypothetical protein